MTQGAVIRSANNTSESEHYSPSSQLSTLVVRMILTWLRAKYVLCRSNCSWQSVWIWRYYPDGMCAIKSFEFRVLYGLLRLK